ncbi:JmjC domain-containing protein 7 [Kappamyces sp. JEL0680]|nr:JmjC domain-containing protein 7 [Kappamyces sp. JEL0680]
MKLQEFYRLLDRANQHPNQQTPIPYIQRQNSSLTEELPSLCGDVGPPFPWASQVFGGEADAINVWIGGSRSTSSLHKDPYENLYGVVTGAKTFVLIPPHSTPWLYRRFYPVSQLDSELQPRLLDPPQQTPWIPLDPDSPSVLDDFPLFANAVSLRVTLYPGDVLYLPSLWYHQVGQIGPETIAVNYWYDMKHDSRYAWSCFQDELLLDQPASDP